jgi:hypothetical protein
MEGSFNLEITYTPQENEKGPIPNILKDKLKKTIGKAMGLLGSKAGLKRFAG